MTAGSYYLTGAALCRSTGLLQPPYFLMFIWWLYSKWCEFLGALCTVLCYVMFTVLCFRKGSGCSDETVMGCITAHHCKHTAQEYSCSQWYNIITIQSCNPSWFPTHLNMTFIILKYHYYLPPSVVYVKRWTNLSLPYYPVCRKGKLKGCVKGSWFPLQARVWRSLWGHYWMLNKYRFRKYKYEPRLKCCSHYSVRQCK